MSIFKRKKKEPQIEDVAESLRPKVLREAKIAPVTCKICGTIYQGDARHLEADMFSIGSPLIIMRCPTCHTNNNVTFEVQENV